MAGGGKGSKGVGDGGVKKHRRIWRDNIEGISNASIRRLARRGGVKRISDHIYDEALAILLTFLECIIRDAVLYAKHGDRNIISALDVVHAVKRHGRTLYGFDDI